MRTPSGCKQCAVEMQELQGVPFSDTARRAELLDRLMTHSSECEACRSEVITGLKAQVMAHDLERRRRIVAAHARAVRVSEDAEESLLAELLAYVARIWSGLVLPLVPVPHLGAGQVQLEFATPGPSSSPIRGPITQEALSENMVRLSVLENPEFGDRPPERVVLAWNQADAVGPRVVEMEHLRDHYVVDLSVDSNQTTDTDMLAFVLLLPAGTGTGQ